MISVNIFLDHIHPLKSFSFHISSSATHSELGSDPLESVDPSPGAILLSSKTQFNN